LITFIDPETKIILFKSKRKDAEILSDMTKFVKIGIILVTAIIICGCDQNIGLPDNIEGYYLEGAAVKNLDLDMLVISATVNRNDSLLTSAVVTVGDDTLKYSGGKYLITVDSASHLSPGSYHLVFRDADLYFDSILFAVPSDFMITSKVPPDTTPYRSGDQVRLEWTTPSDVENYAYGATKAESVYGNDGYAAFVSPLATAVTFDTDAFSLPSGEIDPGLYYIFVYGYAGSPIPGSELPTVFPSGFSNSFTRPDFSGKFGSIVITRRDSVIAATQ
jgi:hypothetical protein